MKILGVLLVVTIFVSNSYVNAGPFGFEHGMNLKQMIDAGFKYDEGKSYLKTHVPNITTSIFLTNKKHPNKKFYANVDQNDGLACFVVDIDHKNPKIHQKLFDSYKDRIGAKYGKKMERYEYGFKIYFTPSHKSGLEVILLYDNGSKGNFKITYQYANYVPLLENYKKRNAEAKSKNDDKELKEATPDINDL